MITGQWGKPSEVLLDMGEIQAHLWSWRTDLSVTPRWLIRLIQ